MFSFDSSIDETYLGGVAVIFSRGGHNVKDNVVLKKKKKGEACLGSHGNPLEINLPWTVGKKHPDLHFNPPASNCVHKNTIIPNRFEHQLL